jgi:hypothetical protein
MRVLRLKEAYPTAKVELWCEDEQRLGLKPIARRVWSTFAEALREGSSAIRVDLSLRLRAAHKRGGLLACAAHRERRGFLVGPGAFR